MGSLGTRMIRCVEAIFMATGFNNKVGLAASLFTARAAAQRAVNIVPAHLSSDQKSATWAASGCLKILLLSAGSLEFMYFIIRQIHLATIRKIFSFYDSLLIIGQIVPTS